MVVTCDDSHGLCSTGMRAVTCGSSAPICATRDVTPATNKAGILRRTEKQARISEVRAIICRVSYVLLRGRWPEMYQRRMSEAVKIKVSTAVIAVRMWYTTLLLFRMKKVSKARVKQLIKSTMSHGTLL